MAGITVVTKLVWMIVLLAIGAVTQVQKESDRADRAEQELEVCHERWPLPPPAIINPDHIKHN